MIVCTFDVASPRITAYDIHEWIHDTLRIPEKTLNMIQTDGPKRQAYIKLADISGVQALLRDTCGQAEYKHNTGKISIVSIAMAGMGTKKIRTANLPPEVPDESLRSTFAPFGKVVTIQEQMWSRTYR